METLFERFSENLTSPEETFASEEEDVLAVPHAGPPLSSHSIVVDSALCMLPAGVAGWLSIATSD